VSVWFPTLLKCGLYMCVHVYLWVCGCGFVCGVEREREIILQLFSTTRVANEAGLLSIVNIVLIGVRVREKVCMCVWVCVCV